MLAPTLLTIVALASAPVPDGFKWTRFGALRMIVPITWSRSDEEGTAKFVAPSGTASFLVDVGTVQSKQPLDPDECLRKIVSQLRPGGFEVLPRSTEAPSARRILRDAFTGTGTEVVSHTYVGCNGITTWSVIFQFEGAREQWFAALSNQIISTLEYLPPEEPRRAREKKKEKPPRR